MTPQQTAVACADAIRDGLIANRTDPGGFWLELLIEFTDFAEATIGEEGRKVLIGHLSSVRGPALN
jgi:hypothetical protein